MPETLTEDIRLARTGPKRIGAGEFLQALYGPYYAKGNRGFVEIRLIGKERVRSYFFRSLELLKKKRFESEKLHTYYGLCPREHREGTKEAVKWSLALWADLDEKNFTGGKEATWERLRGFPISPSVVVDSGHGLQALWFLKEPVEILNPEEIEAYLKGLAKALDGDPAVSDIARIFRLPGSFNVKDPLTPLPVKVRMFSPRERYELSDFNPWRAIPEKPSGSGEGSGIEGEGQEGLEKVLACKFIRYAQVHAQDLPEPLWWSALTNLLPFKGGREKAHEISRPYAKGRNQYSFEETERKIERILKTSPGPHTCRKIVEHGYPCSFVGTCRVDAPAGLAWKDPLFVEGLRKVSEEPRA